MDISLIQSNSAVLDAFTIKICSIRQDSHELKKGTLIAIVATAAIAAGGNLGYWTVTEELPAASFFGAINMIAFSGMETYYGQSFIQLLSTLFKTKTAEEAILQRPWRSPCYELLNEKSRKYPYFAESFIRTEKGMVFLEKAGALSLNITIATLSQFPSSFPILDYNNNKVGPILFTLGVVTSAIFPAVSLWEQTEQISLLLSCNKDRNKAQNELLNLISLAKHNFLMLPQEEKFKFIVELDQLSNDTSHTQLYVDHLLSIRAAHEEPLSKRQNKIAQAAYGYGLFLTVGFLTALTWYTKELSEEYITKDKGNIAVFSLLVIGSMAFLSKTSIADGLKGFCIYAMNKHNGNTSESISEQIRKTQTLALKALASFTCLLALAATIVIWSKFFKRSMAAQVILTPIVCQSILLILLTPFLNSTEGFIKQKILKGNDDQDKKIVKMTYEFDALIELVQKASNDSCQTLIDSLKPLNAYYESMSQKLEMSNAQELSDMS